MELEEYNLVAARRGFVQASSCESELRVERKVVQVAEMLEGMAETLVAADWAATGATEEPMRRSAAAKEPAAVGRLTDFMRGVGVTNEWARWTSGVCG